MSLSLANAKVATPIPEPGVPPPVPGSPGSAWIHRLFLLSALLLLTVGGTTTGAWMLLGMAGWSSLPDWPWALTLHGQLQVMGFMVPFTMGIALMVFPRYMGVPVAAPGLARACLGLMLGGTALQALAWGGPVGPTMQLLATGLFLTVLRATRRSASLPRSVPAGRKSSGPDAHNLFLVAAGLWLPIALVPSYWSSGRSLSLELVLWGFASLYVAGVALRVHPSILGVQAPSGARLPASLLLWNLGLVLRLVEWIWSSVALEALAAALLALGIATFLWELKPFRRADKESCATRWLRTYVRFSYAWLAVSLVGLLVVPWAGTLLDSAVRHSLASGFLLTMMVGMGFRMVPSFELRRLPWPAAPGLCFWLLNLGLAIRVVPQAAMEWTGASLQSFVALGGLLQTLGVWLFAASLALTLLRHDLSIRHAEN
ncbi:MAG: NnrS family protein [Armatimonadetes bacterium]|nr:NnrS family protein [Armatimonadota bacterium]